MSAADDPVSDDVTAFALTVTGAAKRSTQVAGTLEAGYVIRHVGVRRRAPVKQDTITTEAD